VEVHVSVVAPWAVTGIGFDPTCQHCPPADAPAGETWNVTVTVPETYQPPAPAVPLIEYVTSGGSALAIGTSVSETNAT
jgi:hypothetical protein